MTQVQKECNNKNFFSHQIIIMENLTDTIDFRTIQMVLLLVILYINFHI